MSDRPTGDCYAAAGRLITRLSPSEYRNIRLVHATVQVDERMKRHGHAWVEADIVLSPGILGRMALDHSNGRLVEIPADFYRTIGNVDAVVEYDVDDALVLLLKTKHFGPWESES